MHLTWVMTRRGRHHACIIRALHLLPVVSTAVHVATSLPLVVPCGILRFFIAPCMLLFRSTLDQSSAAAGDLRVMAELIRVEVRWLIKLVATTNVLIISTVLPTCIWYVPATVRTSCQKAALSL
jgi:hypothetical protein